MWVDLIHLTLQNSFHNTLSLAAVDSKCLLIKYNNSNNNKNSKVVMFYFVLYQTHFYLRKSTYEQTNLNKSS